MHTDYSGTSAIGSDSKKKGISLWPEWNDADVNAEKWVRAT